MFKDLQKTIMAEYSGVRAKSDVAELARFHRIQASPGFRAAANHVRGVLNDLGVTAEVLRFPADERTTYWGSAQFQEWDAAAGTLYLLNPEDQARKLADYSEIKTSLIQRSAPVDGVEAEVILLEDGEEQAEYDGLDVTGRVVMTRGDIDRVRDLAVNQRGAAGILFDGMHESPPVYQRIDHPDLIRYTSFWWRPGDRSCWGFVVTPRVGEDLRKLIKGQKAAGKPPLRVRANVTSHLYDGEMEVVSASFPGETQEEVVVVAHLCHPQPSANDNGSGSAALVEMARSLSRLLQANRLAKPRRGIRLLWVPEMTGTFAYLASNPERVRRMVAGVNLDMVGENQDLCGGVFVIESPPEAMASFAPDLLACLRDELLGGKAKLAGIGPYSPLRHAVTPFSGGSDHYVFSDPSVGVPMPMLIQWPDKFWHTSGDTLDKVDPRMLGLVGGLATTYAYFIASAGDREAKWLGQEMLARYRMRLAHEVQGALTDALASTSAAELAGIKRRVDRRVQFVAQIQKEAFGTLLRLAPGVAEFVQGLQRTAASVAAQELTNAAEVMLSRARELGLSALRAEVKSDPDEWERRAASLVPGRLFPSPVSPGAYLHRLSPKEREEWYQWHRQHRSEYGAVSTVADYWVDGQRTVADIADLVECETGRRDAQVLIRHFELLRKVGLMSLRSVDTGSS